MNPTDRFKIDNYSQILCEIERLDCLDYPHELEDKIIQEIVRLINEGTEMAKKKILELERMIEETAGTTPQSRFLISALQNAISGALSVAKFCLF